MPFVKQALIKTPRVSPIQKMFKSADSKNSRLVPPSRKNFIGRTRELEFFIREIVQPEEPHYSIISVCGQAGIGKTELLWKYVEKTRLPEFLEYCQPAFVNESQSNPASVMEKIAEQLQMEGDFKKALQQYREIELKLQSPGEATGEAFRRNAPTIAGSFGQQISDAAGEIVKSAVPVFGGVAVAIAKPALTAAGDAIASAEQAKQQIKNAARMEDPLRDLTQAFVEELNRLTTLPSKQTKRQQRFILYIDTLTHALVPWLLNYFLPSTISNNVVLVIASRFPIDRFTIEGPNNWASYIEDGVIYSVTPEVFTASETREYLAARQISDPEQVANIWQASRGLPLFLLLIANRRGKIDPTGSIVENFLRGIPDDDPRQRLSVNGAHFSRPFKRDDLEAFLTLPVKYAFLPEDSGKLNTLFLWLKDQEFIEGDMQGRYNYENFVQDLFSRHLFQRSENEYYATREALANYYEQMQQRMVDQRGEEIYDSPEWLELVKACAFQLLLLPDSRSHLKAIEQVLKANTHFTQSDQLIRMLRKVSQELPDKEVTPDARLVARFLLQYIEAELGSQQCVTAAHFLLEKVKNASSFAPELLATLYRDLGISAVLSNKPADAIEDLNQAARINPDEALVYANRGLAYVSTSEYQASINDLSRAAELGFKNNWIIAMRGLAYLGLGDTQKALEDLNAVLTAQPEEAQIYAFRALVFIYKSEFAQAITDLDHALALNPDEDWAYATRGFAYLSLHEPQRAVEDLNNALRLAPGSPWAYLNRGIAYALMNERDLSMADLNHLVELAPQSAQVYSARGIAYSFLNDPERALRDCELALKLAPHLIEAFLGRGLAYIPLNKPELAVNDFNHVIEQAPRLMFAYVGRGQAYLALNQPLQAIPDLNLVIEQMPRLARAFSSRGLAYATLGDFQRAIDDCNHALELDPKDGWAYASRGFSFAALSESQKAIADCNHALELTPGLAPAYIGLGQAYLQMSDPQKALEALNYAVKLAPHLAPVYNVLGLAYSSMKNVPRALEEFNHALELAPNLAQTYISRGLVYFDSGDPQKALEDLNQALELAPNLAQAYATRGFIHALLNNSEQAFTDCKHALELAPNLALAYMGMGFASLLDEHYPQAITHFDRAAALAPNLALTYRGRGITYLAMEDFQHAVEDMLHTIELAPAMITDLAPFIAEAYTGRGRTFLAQNAYQPAVSDLDQALLLQPENAEALIYRGLAYFYLGEYQKAIPDLDAVIALQPEDARPFAHRGAAYLALDEYQKAITDLDQAIAMQPDDARDYIRRGEAYRQLNQCAPAIQDFTHALELGLANETLVYSRRGQAYASQEDYPNAIEDFSKVLEKSPESVWVYAERARAYAALNDAQHAIEDFDQALKAQPQDVQLYVDRAIVYASQKEYESALQDMNHALDLAPGASELYANRGYVYSLSGEYRRAIEDFTRFLEQNPGDMWALGLQCNAALALNDIEQASADFARMWELDGKDINYGWMAEWAVMCRKMPGTETAERLEALAQADPQREIAFACRGVAHIIHKRFEQALTELQQSITLAPTFYDGYFWVGLAYAYLEKDGEASTAIEKALELKISPVLLDPLRWLELDKPVFYKAYVAPLLARFADVVDRV